MSKSQRFSPWSSIEDFVGRPDQVWPEDDVLRLQAYDKYDEMYWNDPTQYAIRVLEDEEPLYIPNARKIINTTAYYLMKGLSIQLKGSSEDSVSGFLENFLKREAFYSKFSMLKTSTITRGDGIFHIFADSEKKPGSRVSIETVHPGDVYPTYDEDDPTTLVQMDVVTPWVDPEVEIGDNPNRIRVLSYYRDLDTGIISRGEKSYEEATHWWEEDTNADRTLLELEDLDSRITVIPLYWFKNIAWEGFEFGFSELKGLENIQLAVSQGATDTQASLGLEGLGVYATDGGRPVDNQGNETDWEVSPGKVMEVPQGSYFRRVEGVGSISPMQDQITYLENKLWEAAGITGVASGNVDVQVAESGIALALHFIPTLAKLEERDTSFTDILTQMFYDLKSWFTVYEDTTINQDIIVVIDDSKLPINRKERLNELNNMIDRKVISRAYYRQEAVKLGYSFPDDSEMENQIKAEAALEAASDSTSDEESSEEELPPESNPDNGKQETKKENNSNNQSRVNESSGTEA